MTKSNNKFTFKDFMDYVIILIVVILIRTFIGTPALVNGSSMDSTLHDGELVIVNKIIYKTNDINRLDIVVVDNKKEKDRIIKRVIGLPNEKIEYKDNVLYINDEKVNLYGIKVKETEDFVYETKDNEYFVLGDNRIVSKDSRVLGPFSKENIIGRVSFRLLPFKKIGKVK